MDIRPPSDRGIRSYLLITDLIGIAAAYAVAYFLRLQVFDLEQIFSRTVFMFGGINLICLYLADLYEADPQTPSRTKPLLTLAAVFIAGCVIVVTAYFSGAVEFSGIIGRGVLIGAQVSFAIWAAVHRLIISRWVRGAGKRARWLVIGSEENLKPFLSDLSSSKLTGHFALLTPTIHAGDTPDIPYISLSAAGIWADLDKVARETWTGLIVCANNNLPEELVESLMDIRLRGVRVIDLADFYEETWSKVPVFYLQRSWFAMAQGFRLLHNPIGLRVKRIFDIVGALALLILSTPFWILAAIAIKLESRGPVIYSQTRVGEAGRLFTVYKLRSMRTDAEADGAKWTVIGDTRVTRVGSFIRMTRIDELPQLVNVIRGDMSFIGPRPERPEFTNQLEQDIPFYNLRHLLKPGITGWAQVMYPYGASIEDATQKLQFELFYIKNYSLLLDAAIVLKTVRVVLFGQGR